MEVSTQNRAAAWKLLSDSEYLSRYWSDAHQRLLKRGRWWAGLQASLAVGAFGVLMPTSPHWVIPVAQALLAVVSVLILIHNPAWKLASVKVVRDQCGRIESKARRLWTQIESWSISDETVAERWYDLRTDLDDATHKVEIEFKDDDTKPAAELSNRMPLEREFANGS